MARRLAKTALKLGSMVGVVVVAMGLFTAAGKLGWLSPFGLNSESSDTQVVYAIERTQEVSLLSLKVQGLKEETQNATVMGRSVPGTKDKVLLQYEFAAKLGLDGADVDIEQKGGNSYLITLPDFSFIGYDEPTFKVAAEDGGLLSFATTDIDKVEMVNEILDSDARDDYLVENRDLLVDQAQVFYESLVASVDPDAEVSFEFR